MTRDLEQWLTWQESLHPRAIELGLSRVREVAERLQLLQPRCVTLTIAGTNGKGSSATLAASIYRAAGYRVGLYTSPHLQRYNERVQIDDTLATDYALCRAFEAIEQVRGEISLTYFEFGTLAALWLFREAQVQVQVLEVGLGGRLDAVNVLDADAMLITNIGLDHQDWLGHDRDSIGHEKAGVLRAGRPAVYADPQPVASVRAMAQQLDAPLSVLGEDFSAQVAGQTWCWRSGAQQLERLPLPGLSGAAQVRNAAGVLAVITALQPRLPVTESAIRQALPSLRLRGRYQRRGAAILDVAHNVESAQVLAEQLQQETGAGRTFLVLAMLADKPVEAVARILAPCVSDIVVAGLPGARGLSGVALQQRLHAVGVTSHCETDVAAALAWIESKYVAPDRVVVTGSFVTVAAALDYWHE